MKKYFPAAVALLTLAAIALTLRAPPHSGEYDITGFGRLPTLVNGRVKPLDTVARTTLLMLQGRQRVSTPDGGSLAPAEWLLDVFFRPDLADTYQVFEIVQPDLLGLLSLGTTEGAGGKRFSLRQMAPKLGELERQARLADGVESALRTTFQRAAIQLRSGILLYQELQVSLMAPGNHDFFTEVGRIEQMLPAIAAGRAPKPGDGTNDATLLLEMATTFATMEQSVYLHPVTQDGTGAPSDWKTFGGAWSQAVATGRVAPSAQAFVGLGRAWHGRDAEAFNRAVTAQHELLARSMPAVMNRCGVEFRFNSAQPFYSAATVYVIALLLGVISWLRWGDVLGRSALALMLVAFGLSSVGIVTRMWLESRPPVTNLYSSALFVGWGAVLLCLILEKLYRNGIGSVAGGVIGFATLVIAHHLALGGDTMEMMRAVLDSNFWLATHVVTIAIGYSATFLAGFLALIYVLRGVLTKSLDAATASSLNRMIYGIVCFATLFSFVGTILGGIWADQSWGRFWGWDPKENGALLIVLWNAILLHARWGGYVQARGLAVLALFGNIVTAWSWFGVNMLGVGLHSYGFMDAAFWALVVFVVSQLAVILMAALPVARWRSFRGQRV